MLEPSLEKRFTRRSVFRRPEHRFASTRRRCGGRSLMSAQPAMQPVLRGSEQSSPQEFSACLMPNPVPLRMGVMSIRFRLIAIVPARRRFSRQRRVQGTCPPPSRAFNHPLPGPCVPDSGGRFPLLKCNSYAHVVSFRLHGWPAVPETGSPSPSVDHVQHGHRHKGISLKTRG